MAESTQKPGGESLSPARQRKKICFIANPNAGNRLSARIRESIHRQLDLNLFQYEIWFTERPGHARELAEKAVADHFDIVVAVGGDGSVNEVAQGLIDTDTAMGIVPAGSGNGMAMALGYGRNMDNAVKMLNTAQTVRIDTGLMNGKPFVNLAGVGFEGLVSTRMQGQSFRGLAPYFYNSVKAGLEFDFRECILETPEKTESVGFFSITIANGPMYGYNFKIAPDARFDDGFFNVVVLKKSQRWKYFASLPAMLTGDIYNKDYVDHFTTNEIKLKLKGTHFAQIDGEGFELEGDIHFTMKPASLSVLYPNADRTQESQPTSFVQLIDNFF